MKAIRTFTVASSLPPELESLRELAYNLRWSWNHETIQLFRRLDRSLWEETDHNPVLMLGAIRQAYLRAAAADQGFLAHLERVSERFRHYMEEPTWYDQHISSPDCEHCIAYFSAEFAIAECIPVYSGGLGILSGDHLKAASDLGLPMVGVGLLYQEGYFRQYLSADGWQQESYPLNDLYNMPIRLRRDDDGDPLTVAVDFPGRKVKAQVWQADVGRVPLFLLDTNIPENSSEDQDITDELYGGDLEMRIKQEIILGIGGIRVLEAINLCPSVCHMNEGHSAFLAIERIRMLMEKHSLSFAEAREIATAGSVFTTHTPVPAGIDIFPPHLIDKYFGHYYDILDISRNEFLGLGRMNPYDEGESINMAIMAMRLASYTNGVSRLHGQVARSMWQNLWSGVPQKEIPIAHITNGVHIPSWVSRDMSELYDRYLGTRWRQDAAEAAAWKGIDKIPDGELWRTHERRRERLVAMTRRRLVEQLESRGAPVGEVAQAKEALNPKALTIGFARRFATYKRATLILRDLERLARIVGDPQRPVQFVFAGKAHPRDTQGKELIRQIIHTARRDEFRGHIVFLENYDMNLARYILQGVDVWLNTPRRPREASGTSGMKAAANGAINLSILDGWWDEAYTPEVGWAIGRGEVYDDHNYQDEVESRTLYELLEKEIVPLFYIRGRGDLPRKWITRMKASMDAVCPVFNTSRMVLQYLEDAYAPAAQRFQRMIENDMAGAKALAAWRSKLHRHWDQIKILGVEDDSPAELQVGNSLHVQVEIALGELEPSDVRVEFYHGRVDQQEQIIDGQAVAMTHAEPNGGGSYIFSGIVPCEKSGQYGYAIRILPQHPDLGDVLNMHLIRWA
ncbi:MAG: alpha-glucan phosphorylase [Anaerolineaceae bacterium 4572_32.2]|nr:MAG: alpha-glucan phosphorylase [Anaerolineaceae bacterium 4572_32.2]